MCDTREIPIGRGLVALVDAEDYEWLNTVKWFPNSGRAAVKYATRMSYEGGQRVPLAMHREVLNAPPHAIVDHINHNGLDNRKCNLRLCNKSQNSANQPPKPGRYKGVYFRRGSYMARIVVDQKPIYLGNFRFPEDAAQAYNDAALKYFGEFACLNVIVRDLVSQKG